jgi:hypothetical protein
LPWKARISVDLNYLAAPTTLTSPSTGLGLLDGS